MGEPAIPTPKDRAETRALAARVVESVRSDSRMPLELQASSVAEHAHGRCVRRADVEQLAFQFAQEIEALASQLAAAKAASSVLSDRVMEMANYPESTARAFAVGAALRSLDDALADNGWAAKETS